MSPSPPPEQLRTAPELRIAASALKLLALLVAPTLGLGWLAAGGRGLAAGAMAVGLVAALYGLTAVFLAVAARISPAAMFAAALGGFALRLVLYAILLVALTPLDVIDGQTLAVATVVLAVITLVWEARHVARTPEFFWLDTAAGHVERRGA